ncbi:MAG: methyltransferase domain-containing protein [Bdellovibrionota bacterium]|nr:MAG: methyltransferase domain-containing protein [Bdellovibrionota bacterium]
MVNDGLTFESVAEDYDKYRGSYPAEFMDMVLEPVKQTRGGKVCEIGCGSGQATLRLAEMQYEVTCIEPGLGLLKLARNRLAHYPSVSFQLNTFEDADLPFEHFDLVFAANSLHWVSSDQRFKKPHEILKPGGNLVAVWRWNHPLSGPLGDALHSIFAEKLPTYRIETRDEYELGALTYFNEMAATKLYWQCQVRRTPYSWSKPAQDFVNWMGTWSQLASLSPSERDDVLERTRSVIIDHGGSIFESGETVSIYGQKPLRSG